MDPLSITASLLAVLTAAAQSTKALMETVKRFKDRNKTLRRLQSELGDLTSILDSLMQLANVEDSMLTLLKGPVERCSEVCREFEESMKVFSGKSKTGFLDWTKMEFMRGDINEFIDTVAGYKSTIAVGLGTITMRTSKISRQVLEEYNEMIQDTSYNLELRLQRIDEMMKQFTIENTKSSSISINLKDEREVTQQCLLICEDARSYIESLSNRESSLLREAPQNAVEEDFFDAQLRARQALDENRHTFAETITHLRKRLESLVQKESSGNDSERTRLQADIDISKQCLDICKAASEVSRQKIFRIGEVVADGDSDQVVVTTLADLFDVKKATSKNRSAQLVGSMAGEELMHLTERRYSSRFGASVGGSDAAEAGATGSPSVFDDQKNPPAFSPQTGNHEQSPGQTPRQDRPSPNQMRKRLVGGAEDEEKRRTTEK